MSKIRKHANTIVALLLAATVAMLPLAAPAAPAPKASRYQVLAPITQDNLTIFPIASSGARDSAAFLTLDEGLTTGQVVVTEAGSRLTDTMPVRAERELRIPRGDGAEVNRLVLINKSERPLLLLARTASSPRTACPSICRSSASNRAAGPAPAVRSAD